MGGGQSGKRRHPTTCYLAMNMLGDGLRDALDPRLKN